MAFTNTGDSLRVPSMALDSDPHVDISTDDPLMRAFADAGIAFYYGLGKGFVLAVDGDGTATGIFRIVAGPADANFANRDEFLHAEYDADNAEMDFLSLGPGNRINAPTPPRIEFMFQGGPLRSTLDLYADQLSINGPVDVTGKANFLGAVDGPGIVYHTAYSGTTDASGFLTVTHGAPWTPTAGWFITTNPAGSFAQAWGIDNIGATTARLRFTSTAATGALASTAVSGRLFLVK